MKALKIALLGTAALAAASVSARADALADLKSAILGSDDSYVSATADVPASGTMITWSGAVKVGLVYESYGATTAPVAPARTTTDMLAKGAITVSGKTDTAVGEVGASVGIAYSAKNMTAITSTNPFTLDSMSGYWKMTPNLTLKGGWDVAPGGVGGFGGDIIGTVFVGGVDNPASPIAAVGWSLGYADGPLSVDVGVAGHDGTHGASLANHFSFGAGVGYSMDSISFKLGGIVDDGAWSVGLGAKATMDMITLSAAVGTNSASAWTASIGATANLADTMSVHLAASTNSASDIKAAGGIYYTPVSQLKIGVEASYADLSNNATTPDYTKAALVTVFSF